MEADWTKNNEMNRKDIDWNKKKCTADTAYSLSEFLSFVPFFIYNSNIEN